MERREVLGGLLKRIGNFDNRSLETRIIFQKTTYFLQVFGINLGYKFNYYVYGPYSTELAKDGYILQNIFESMPPLKFEGNRYEELFTSFQRFVLPHAGDSRWLEAAASMHIIKKLRPSATKAELIKSVKDKRKNLNNDQFCEEVYSCLVKNGLLAE